MNEFSRKGEVRRYGRVGVVVAIAAGTALWACGTSDRSATPAPAGAPATPQSGTVPLTRHAHPFARPEFDRGPLDPAKRLSNLSLVFRMTPEQIRERDALKSAQLAGVTDFVILPTDHANIYCDTKDACPAAWPVIRERLAK